MWFCFFKSKTPSSLYMLTSENLKEFLAWIVCYNHNWWHLPFFLLEHNYISWIWWTMVTRFIINSGLELMIYKTEEIWLLESECPNINTQMLVHYSWRIWLTLLLNVQSSWFGGDSILHQQRWVINSVLNVHGHLSQPIHPWTVLDSSVQWLTFGQQMVSLVKHILNSFLSVPDSWLHWHLAFKLHCTSS